MNPSSTLHSLYTLRASLRTRLSSLDTSISSLTTKLNDLKKESENVEEELDKVECRTREMEFMEVGASQAHGILVKEENGMSPASSSLSEILEVRRVNTTAERNGNGSNVGDVLSRLPNTSHQKVGNASGIGFTQDTGETQSSEVLSDSNFQVGGYGGEGKQQKGGGRRNSSEGKGYGELTFLREGGEEREGGGEGEGERSTNSSTASPPHLVGNNTATTTTATSSYFNNHNTSINNKRNPLVPQNPLTNDNPKHELTARIQQTLQRTFKLSSFRPNQLDVIKCTLVGNDVFLLMRTGGGKSLCTYQLPAVLERSNSGGVKAGVTVVVVPLISLMEDQVKNFNGKVGYGAVGFKGSGKGKKKDEAMDDLGKWGEVMDGRANLVFCTPEKLLQSSRFQQGINRLYREGRIRRFVIDEAHCVSQWGHDFRDTYTQLGWIRRNCQGVGITACTATATDVVAEDVKKILLIPNAVTFKTGLDRPNLIYEIRHKEGAAKMLEDMVAFIKGRGSGIVYVLSKKESLKIAGDLKKEGVKASAYNSTISEGVKSRVLDDWIKGKTQVVVATIAFGMGIDKPDCRWVIHHTMSKNLESYSQETGRCGRDGKRGECVLYYNPRETSKMVAFAGPDKGIWQMIRYCEEMGTSEVCRALLLRGLGEMSKEDCAVVITGEKDKSGIEVDCTLDAKVLVGYVDRAQQVTIAQISAEWRKANPGDDVLVGYEGRMRLSKDRVEHMVVQLLIKKILGFEVVSNKHASNMYIVPGPLGGKLIGSDTAKVICKFREEVKGKRGGGKRKGGEGGGGGRTTAGGGAGSEYDDLIVVGDMGGGRKKKKKKKTKKSDKEEEKENGGKITQYMNNGGGKEGGGRVRNFDPFRAGGEKVEEVIDLLSDSEGEESEEFEFLG